MAIMSNTTRRLSWDDILSMSSASTGSSTLTDEQLTNFSFTSPFGINYDMSTSTITREVHEIIEFHKVEYNNDIDCNEVMQ